MDEPRLTPETIDAWVREFASTAQRVARKFHTLDGARVAMEYIEAGMELDRLAAEVKA